MKKLFFILTILISLSIKSQINIVTYEWFSLSGGFLYSIEDQYTGLNGKINFPLGSHAKFVMQASLFPEQFQDPEKSFNEARAKFNVEFIPIKFKKVYLSLQTGFDFGYWQRTFLLTGSTLGLDWKKDESMMFGGIINYDLNRYRFYLDYMYMPEVFSNHLGIGFALLLFENNSFRKKYIQRKYVKTKKTKRKKSKSRGRKSDKR
jgi:hypothetical protein